MRVLVLILLLLFAGPGSEAFADSWVRTVQAPVYCAVDVDDVDAAVDWYRQLFDLEVIDDTTADDGRWRIVNLGSAAIAIEIIYDRRSTTQDEAVRARGFAKLGVSVPDVRQVADRIEAATGERPRVLEFERHGIFLVQLHDPEGNTIQLHSPILPAQPDEDVLLGLHRDVLRSHLESDLESWMASESQDYLSVNRGQLQSPSLEERRARLGPYLASTTFSEYRDLVEPVVRVSADGSMGWVACQVSMKGEQRTGEGNVEPITAVWAWIELYEKVDGNWMRVGNASSRLPRE